ncbi:MAG TPA: SDR family NAD(P)-dependent oxidoreductase [Ilumatobacteraceae bacterium]|jgi:NAD(P)-dependent dehydrogenase (short-subunit alcohol dehydrogenase family)
MRRFEGRNAIVTGASRGIGAAIAERLAAEGASVVVTARTLDAHDHLDGSLTETLRRCRRHGAHAEAVAADLGDPIDRQRIVPAAVDLLGGPIDILVNNAAAAIYQSMLDYSPRRRTITFEVNLQAPIDLAQAVIPAMMARGEGWIVNVSSATARAPSGPPFRTAGVATKVGIYGASKAALNRATLAFAVELQSAGVRINTVEPRAAVWSEGAQALLGQVDDSLVESMEAMVEAAVALCCCGPGHTGNTDISLDLIDEMGLTVMNLDGQAPYVPHA